MITSSSSMARLEGRRSLWLLGMCKWGEGGREGGGGGRGGVFKCGVNEVVLIMLRSYEVH
jgi:hypothetical protein